MFRTATFFDVSPPDPNNGNRTFIPPSAGVLNVEQGQATPPKLPNVLEPQVTTDGSLVYIMTTMNDVCALLTTGVAGNSGTANPPFPMPPNFPTTAGDLALITAFATFHGVTFPDPNALCIIVKSSWVLASSVQNPSTYIMAMAKVPTYDTIKDAPNWDFNGTQPVQLAMVGMHVVGSAAGHPEMIWATFEHQDNAPRDQYTYFNSSGSLVTVNQLLGANWEFTSTNSNGPFNVARMSAPPIVGSQPNIVPTATPPGISPSDTIRRKAFGAASDGAPNPNAKDSFGNPSNTASNTEVISINNNIIAMLQALGTPLDVRSNYVMTGAQWTENGAAPTCFFQQPKCPNSAPPPATSLAPVCCKTPRWRPTTKGRILPWQPRTR